MGPFHKTVLAARTRSPNKCTVSGPISRPISSSPIDETSETRNESSSNLFASRASNGRRISTPFSFARRIISPAKGILSSSSKERPILCPCAARKVNAIPPPIQIVAAFSRRCSTTPILSETFAPPRRITKGGAGESLTLESIDTSLSRRSPANEGRNFVTPLVDASARCAALNASMMNTSKGAASCDAKRSSFSCSSL